MDSLRLRVKGGTGGTGLPRYGGIGGRGGDVVVVATEELSLNELASQYKTREVRAFHGHHSECRGIVGKCGENVEIPVPRGVTVYDRNGVAIGN